MFNSKEKQYFDIFPTKTIISNNLGLKLGGSDIIFG